MIVIVTYLSVIIGELVPKNLALRNAERIACMVAPFMTMVARVAKPAVWLLDLASGAVRNYSNSPVYEEVEGVSPDGEWALVERDLESVAVPSTLDVWRLSLDGNATWERLTYFNRYRGGYYASNPTVHPKGGRFAFQLSFDGPKFLK